MIVDLFGRYNEIAMKVREFAYMLRGIAEIALNENEKLIMINHKIPMGLFPKIEAYFDYEVEELKDGNVRIIFTKKENLVPKLDFDTNCLG